MRIASRLLIAAALAAVPLSAGLAQTIVPVGPFRSVELRGGGHVTLHNGPAQRVVLNAGNLQYTSFRNEDGSLVIDACNNSCPNGRYDLEIDIATPRLDGVAVEGGGSIVGDPDLPVQNLHAAVKGGGLIDMRAVHAQTVDAAVEGGGHIQIFAQSSLRAAVSGGGHIEYWGHPNLATAISGGGDIRPGH